MDGAKVGAKADTILDAEQDWALLSPSLVWRNDLPLPPCWAPLICKEFVHSFGCQASAMRDILRLDF